MVLSGSMTSVSSIILDLLNNAHHNFDTLFYLVFIFHDESLFLGVSGEPLVRMSDAVWTATVIERMRFMGVRPVEKQPMGLWWYNLTTVYYFSRIPTCDVKEKIRRKAAGSLSKQMSAGQR